MLREYRKINVHLLEGEHCLATPQPNFEDLTLDSPATALMVDFNLSKPITAADNISTSDALELMRTNHVRMLIIVNKPGEFSGIVTAMDLMGRKPIMYASQAGIAYANVMVKNVMTHKDHIHAISLTDVEKASLGDVITTLNSLHEQHILILDEETEPKTRREALRSVSMRNLTLVISEISSIRVRNRQRRRSISFVSAMTQLKCGNTLARQEYLTAA